MVKSHSGANRDANAGVSGWRCSRGALCSVDEVVLETGLVKSTRPPGRVFNVGMRSGELEDELLQFQGKFLELREVVRDE